MNILVFLDGPGRVRQLSRSPVKIIEGRLRSCVTVTDTWIRHVLCLHNSPGVDGTGLMIENDIDLTSASMNNREIAMRISSNLNSGDVFFTDLNGFQVSSLSAAQINFALHNIIILDDEEEAVQQTFRSD